MSLRYLSIFPKDRAQLASRRSNGKGHFLRNCFAPVETQRERERERLSERKKERKKEREKERRREKERKKERERRENEKEGRMTGKEKKTDNLSSLLPRQ